MTRRGLADIRTGIGPSPPQPPSVIYTGSTRHAAPHAAAPMGYRSPELTPIARASSMMHDNASRGVKANPAINKQPARDADAGPPLGPPPPYRPIAMPPRPPPPRVEMAPIATPAVPVNIRVIGALGPPPPYRPIVQTSQVFARGPAPDLEPWRIASLTQALVDRDADPIALPTVVDPADADWSISREPDPEAVSPPTRIDETRFEIVKDAEAQDFPFDWPEGTRAPGSSGSTARLALWAAGTAVVVLMAGVALYAGRGTLARVFPRAAAVHTARTVTDGPSVTGAVPRAASRDAGCTGGSRPGQTMPADNLTAACEGSKSGPVIK